MGEVGVGCGVSVMGVREGRDLDKERERDYFGLQNRLADKCAKGFFPSSSFIWKVPPLQLLGITEKKSMELRIIGVRGSKNNMDKTRDWILLSEKGCFFPRVVEANTNLFSLMMFDSL